jgi:hypothetical protein
MFMLAGEIPFVPLFIPFAVVFFILQIGLNCSGQAARAPIMAPQVMAMRQQSAPAQQQRMA